MAKKAKSVYKLKTVAGEFNKSATVREAAKALGMTADKKDNAALIKWVDDNATPKFNWGSNPPSTINGALKTGAAGARKAGAKAKRGRPAGSGRKSKTDFHNVTTRDVGKVRSARAVGVARAVPNGALSIETTITLLQELQALADQYGSHNVAVAAVALEGTQNG